MNDYHVNEFMSGVMTNHLIELSAMGGFRSVSTACATYMSGETLVGKPAVHVSSP